MCTKQRECTNLEKQELRITSMQLLEKSAPSPMGHHGIDTRTYSSESLAHLQGLGNSATVSC